MAHRSPLRILFPTRFHIFDQLAAGALVDAEIAIYSIYTTRYFRTGRYRALGPYNHTLWLGLALRGVMHLAVKAGLRGASIRWLRSLYMAGCGTEFYLRTRNAPQGVAMASAGYLGHRAAQLQRHGHRVVINHGSLHETTVRDRLRTLPSAGNTEVANWSHPNLIARMDMEFSVADSIILCSPTAYDSFPPLLHYKLVVVPLGAAVPAATSVPDGSLPVQVENGITFLHISNLSFGKNLIGVLEAFAIMRGPHDRLIIGGPAPQDQALRQRLTAPGVQWLGRLDAARVALALEGADVFVHPSFADGWAMAVTEALAAGLPVVASPFVGAASYYAAAPGGKDAILLPDPTDSLDIAAAMTQMRQTLMDNLDFAHVKPMSWAQSADLLANVLAPVRDANT